MFMIVSKTLPPNDFSTSVSFRCLVLVSLALNKMPFLNTITKEFSGPMVFPLFCDQNQRSFSDFIFNSINLHASYSLTALA